MKEARDTHCEFLVLKERRRYEKPVVVAVVIVGVVVVAVAVAVAVVVMEVSISLRGDGMTYTLF